MARSLSHPRRQETVESRTAMPSETRASVFGGAYPATSGGTEVGFSVVREARKGVGPGALQAPHRVQRRPEGSAARFLESIVQGSTPARLEVDMEVQHPKCAGLDVHKSSVVACARIMSGSRVSHQTRTFGTTTKELLA